MSRTNLRRRSPHVGNAQTGGTLTEPVAAGSEEKSWLGEQIDAVCKENKLIAVGIQYLPNGEAPKGLESVFVPGAFHLVARTSGMVLRGNFVLAIPENWVPQSILR